MPVVPVLSAAVEVAVYRIVVEALTNAVRHSGTDRALVVLAVVGDDLVVEVTDGGGRRGAGVDTPRGPGASADGADTWRRGVGLSSMRERAHELGGSLEAGPGDTGGQVRAVLPLSPASTTASGHETGPVVVTHDPGPPPSSRRRAVQTSME